MFCVADGQQDYQPIAATPEGALAATSSRATTIELLDDYYGQHESEFLCNSKYTFEDSG